MDSFFSSLWPVATELESGTQNATPASGTTLKMEVLKAARIQEPAVMTADIEPAEKTTVEKRTDSVDIGGMKFDQTRDGMSLAGHGKFYNVCGDFSAKLWDLQLTLKSNNIFLKLNSIASQVLRLPDLQRCAVHAWRVQQCKP